MARDTTPSVSVVLSARRLTRRLESINDQSLVPVGLKLREFAILAYLYKVRLDGGEGALKTTLADFTSIPYSSVSRYVESLRTQGWLAYRLRTADRKRLYVAITTKGCAQFRRALPFWYRAQELIRSSLGNEAASALDRVLHLTSTRLKE
jgi:DNA-binding MarR family transcriptional regulator